MEMIEAATLGAVQGLGEFLPISSSGHLIIVPWLLGWNEHSQAFDVAKDWTERTVLPTKEWMVGTSAGQGVPAKNWTATRR